MSEKEKPKTPNIQEQQKYSNLDEAVHKAAVATGF